jgi:DNA-binding transcriptional LysR family regulator
MKPALPNRRADDLALPPGRPGLSGRGLKIGHLRLMAALGRWGQISRAAQDLGLTQPAASRLAAEIQHIVGRPVYDRTGRGIELTEAGQMLARRALRALQEIDDAGREIAELDRAPSGEVRIGSVTGPAIEHVMPILRAARLSMPGVTIAVEVATSDQLCAHLMDGRIDIALGRLTGTGDAGMIDLQPVAPEPVDLAVRAGHPLLREEPVPAARLLDFSWVLPMDGAILRDTVTEALARRGLAPPANAFVTSSFLLTLALVSQTNAIAPVAAPVARAFSGAQGGIRRLRSDLGIEVGTFGLMLRRGRQLTPAGQAVLALLRSQIAAGGPTQLEAGQALA